MQVPGRGFRMKANVFRRALKDSKLRELMLRYTLALISQISQSAACNRLHSVDARCARWLLVTHDRVKKQTFPLTQEFLAQMLGVRRASVSGAAGMLQKRGLITYKRGIIHISDRRGLEAASCGCYLVIRNEFKRLLGRIG